MNKLLVLCGPTATGKTALGIVLAKQFNGEIISADSRQVYSGMTVGTGKEYSDEVKIWGYDLVSPQEDFSLAHFQSFAHQKIADISSRGKLPILVGGTGLYIKSVLENFNTTDVKPDPLLRKRLETKTATELFAELSSVNSEKASSLNESDKKNPRRLIRALEISLAGTIPQREPTEYDTLIIGLKSEFDVLEERLKQSIERRMRTGMIEEVTLLLSQGVSVESRAMTATGYGETADYILGKDSLAVALQKWFLSERGYVKRQLTWFNKLKNVLWFDITDPGYKEKVEVTVKKWDNK